MYLLRYRPGPGQPAAAGLLVGERIVPLGDTLAPLWALTREELRRHLSALASEEGFAAEGVELLAPIDGLSEVWACGVTYEISREARTEESEHDADIYRRVYDAERPELFFKAVAWRVRGPGEAIAVRDDSSVDVPEPELALVCNRHGEIVGYSICNDVSSRSIEGENPLYLPQAKSYLGSCALGPAIRPAWEVADAGALTIALAIERGGAVIWEGTTSTARLHRHLEELVGYLFRADRHPDGAVLSTGTCLVPETPFSLAQGDVVRIAIDEIGTLANPVARGLAALEATPPLAAGPRELASGGRTPMSGAPA